MLLLLDKNNDLGASMNDYDLVFIRISDGKRFKARRCDNASYGLEDPDTMERFYLSRYAVFKDYKSDKKVSRKVCKIKTGFKNKRGFNKNTKAIEDKEAS